MFIMIRAELILLRSSGENPLQISHMYGAVRFLSLPKHTSNWDRCPPYCVVNLCTKQKEKDCELDEKGERANN